MLVNSPAAGLLLPQAARAERDGRRNNQVAPLLTIETAPSAATLPEPPKTAKANDVKKMTPFGTLQAESVHPREPYTAMNPSHTILSDVDCKSFTMNSHSNDPSRIRKRPAGERLSIFGQTTNASEWDRNFVL